MEPTVTADMNVALDRDFQADEVEQALKQMVCPLSLLQAPMVCPLFFIKLIGIL